MPRNELRCQLFLLQSYTNHYQLHDLGKVTSLNLNCLKCKVGITLTIRSALWSCHGGSMKKAHRMIHKFRHLSQAENPRSDKNMKFKILQTLKLFDMTAKCKILQVTSWGRPHNQKHTKFLKIFHKLLSSEVHKLYCIWNINGSS